MKERGYAAPALEKGLAVLELLVREGMPLSQAEIAKGLGRSANELYRMLAVLERSRYIQRDELSGKYSLSLKVFCLGQSVRIIEQLKGAAVGPMRTFSEETGKECHLSVLEEGRLVVVHQSAGSGAIRLSIEPGSVHCPPRTASGRVILARMVAREREQELELTRKAFPEVKFTKHDWKALGSESIHWEEDETLVGISDGAVVVGAENGFRAALATSFFRTGVSPLQRDQIAKRLAATAADIRRTLGIDEV